MSTSYFDELSKLPFPEFFPTPESSARLRDELQFQRAVQVYLWALPAMNLAAMREGQAAKFGAGNNVLAIWKDRIDAKTIITTANPDVIPAQAYLDLKDGPLVYEAAPQMQGLLDDFWHRPTLRCRAGRARQRKRRQVSAAAAGLHRRDTGRLFRAQVADVRRAPLLARVPGGTARPMRA
jgi:hypothetical protein